MTTLVNEQELQSLVIQKLTGAGLQEEHAAVVADILVHADKRGVSSHGVLRTEHYVKRIKSGGINTNPQMKWNNRSSVHRILNGDDGMGHVIMKEAMDEAVAAAKQFGIGVIGMNHSSHCGALSYYAEQAAEEGIISMIMTHTDSAVVPHGGAESYFGTNPIAYGFPADKHPSIILDMATSNVALGKILYARETNQNIPSDWGVNEEGKAETDPHQVKNLLPAAGPKGYGLGMVVDILSGVLTGSAFGKNINPMYAAYDKPRGLGHFIITISPDIFIGAEEYYNSIDQMIEEIGEIKPAEGVDRVLVPGEPERLKAEKSAEEGIQISESVLEYLKS
jgi:ureidoglycolate dehydrogenase (NAD+)